MSDKVQVSLDDLTLRELHQVRKLAGAPLEELMAGEDQALGLAAIVCVLRQRDDPTFTFDQALDTPMKDLQIGAPDPEVSSGDNGATPRSSPAPGRSTQPTSSISPSASSTR